MYLRAKWISAITGIFLTSAALPAMAQDQCKDILANNIFDITRTSASRDFQSSVVDWFCSNEVESSDRGIDIGGKATLLAGDLPGIFQGHEILKDTKGYQRAACRNRREFLSEATRSSFFSKIANSGIVGAWKDCMGSGARAEGTHVSATLSRDGQSLNIHAKYHTEFVAISQLRQVSIRSITIHYGGRAPIPHAADLVCAASEASVLKRRNGNDLVFSHIALENGEALDIQCDGRDASHPITVFISTSRPAKASEPARIDIPNDPPPALPGACVATDGSVANYCVDCVKPSWIAQGSRNGPPGGISISCSNLAAGRYRVLLTGRVRFQNQPTQDLGNIDPVLETDGSQRKSTEKQECWKRIDRGNVRGCPFDLASDEIAKNAGATLEAFFSFGSCGSANLACETNEAAWRICRIDLPNCAAGDNSWISQTNVRFSKRRIPPATINARIGGK